MSSIDRDGNVAPASRTLKILLALSLLLAGCLCTPALKLDPLVVHEQLLWVQGGAGLVHTYRIPIITSTPRGTLLAFAEARKDNSGDVGAKFIALRRSTDRGATWSPTVFIVNDGTFRDGLNLGVVVVDEQKDLIILVYAICFHHFHCTPASTMMVQSRDDGVTWSPPRNLSVQIGVRQFVPGPGYGVQKRHPPAVGRLIVCGHGTLDVNGIFCLLSDDHGQNWRWGAMLKRIPYSQHRLEGDFNPDEPQPMEMEDGSIVINARNENKFHCRCRVVAHSTDGMETLPVDYVRFDATLIDPTVCASALMKGGVMFFTNPADTHKRVNLTLRWSLTNGTSWENRPVLIHGGPSGYSCLASLGGDSPEDSEYIYVLYEKGSKTSIDWVSFTKIHLYGGR